MCVWRVYDNALLSIDQRYRCTLIYYSLGVMPMQTVIHSILSTLALQEQVSVSCEPMVACLPACLSGSWCIYTSLCCLGRCCTPMNATLLYCVVIGVGR